MTEATGQITSNLLPPASRKPGSVGMATEVEVLILDARGSPLPPDTEGEICIRGPSVTTGYLNDNKRRNATDSSFTTDRFFRTGDYGRCDGDGYFFLTGRIKEVINKGGEKISSSELDVVIVRYSAVIEAATFAVDDDMYGQDIGVAITVIERQKISAVGLRRWVKERVAAYKVPKKLRVRFTVFRGLLGGCLWRRAVSVDEIQIFFMTEIPKTATGKVRRNVLAEMALGKNGVMSKL